jgi:hypothetical protein
VRFIPTEDPLVFLPVTVDGERLVLDPRDTMTVDMLGPGQSIYISVGWRL